MLSFVTQYKSYPFPPVPDIREYGLSIESWFPGVEAHRKLVNLKGHDEIARFDYLNIVPLRPNGQPAKVRHGLIAILTFFKTEYLRIETKNLFLVRNQQRHTSKACDHVIPSKLILPKPVMRKVSYMVQHSSEIDMSSSPVPFPLLSAPSPFRSNRVPTLDDTLPSNVLPIPSPRKLLEKWARKNLKRYNTRDRQARD